jgi:hypothetical protein
MTELSKDHDDFLVKAARWIKAHRKSYCPITAVKHISNWKQVMNELKRWGLVQPYKGGETIIITKAGWEYLAAKYSEVVQRRRPKPRL